MLINLKYISKIFLLLYNYQENKEFIGNRLYIAALTSRGMSLKKSRYYHCN